MHHLKNRIDRRALRHISLTAEHNGGNPGGDVERTSALVLPEEPGPETRRALYHCVWCQLRSHWTTPAVGGPAMEENVPFRVASWAAAEWRCEYLQTAGVLASPRY